MSRRGRSPNWRWVALAGALAAACDSPPSGAGLPEWSAADHDHAEEVARPGAPSDKPALKAEKPLDPVLEAAWAQQCAPCHGPAGRGDGPNGPMVHAADLTSADWQSGVTDEQIAASIVRGKGKMPPFPSLPPKVLAGLVVRIRATRGR